MFGQTGSKNCGTTTATTKPTGWVSLAPSTNALVAAAAECLTKTQWTWAPSSNDYITTVALGMTEDWKTGSGGAAGVGNYYYVLGGTTNYVTYGLGNYWAYTAVVDL